MRGFYLTRLTLLGYGVPDAEVLFTAGLNVIHGPSDTGKTFIVQCIDYMLGGAKAPKPIPESELYETVRLGLRLYGQEAEIVLERSIRDGDFLLHIDKQATLALKAKHNKDDKDNISAYLLTLSGLNDKVVRTNKEGKKRTLSFRDLARLILVDEESIITEKSPIYSGQVIHETVESAIFRLLLTGIDDSSVVTIEDPKVSKGRQKGKTELLELLINRTSDRLTELQLPGELETWQAQLEQIELLYVKAESELKIEQQSAAKLEEHRRKVWGQLRRVESRADVLTELQRRFKLLDQQYLSDLQRLESIAEAGTRLGQMIEERCPVCGAHAEHQSHDRHKPEATPEDVAQACLVEANKIKALIYDLNLTRKQNDIEIQNLPSKSSELKKYLQAVIKELNEHLKPRIDIALQRFRESQAQRETYRNAIQIRRQADEFNTLMKEISNQKTDKSQGLPSAKLRTDEAEEFSKEIEFLLRKWHFPNLDRVTFSDSDQDVVVSGRKRASHGKGVRAIIHAAFNLALMRFSDRQSMPHPGFVLIDSPLVVYREPDPDEDGLSINVKDEFYRSIAVEFENMQVVILENEDPPEDLNKSTNIINFTGADHGRKGFIPTSF